MKIAHISDIHCGEVHFVPGLMERAINEINEQEPDIVVCSGDLTAMGFKHEYLQAKGYLDRIECDCVVVIPGNHDSRNVGYIHFEELFGSRNHVVQREGVTIVAVDSTEPDLDHGQIGRGRYPWIEEKFAEGDAELRIFVLHHHLLPIPGTGRERNIVYDAGDAIVREVHGANRGRGDFVAVRALAVIDGEHYASTVRDALAELPYEFVGAFMAGGTE